MYHSFLAQRSKLTWIRKGDMNTSYFHACLKKRRTDNSIATYITEQGTLIDDFQEISIDQQLLLLKPFSSKEIRDAFFGIPSTKSPGPDGFDSGFFKDLWQDIGKDICSTIVQGFATRQFPSELHETTISLVPKVSNPTWAIDYRPIACCSTLYKCMDKLLCSRMHLVLPILIQPNQGDFVRGRSIAHNIMIFQDLIKKYGRASTSPRCAIKIDLSKAYDTVDWQFLEDLLRAFCFLMKFIGWITTCVRNTSYSLLMNGKVQSSFKGTLSAVSIFKEVLGKFSEATGLSINTNKSHIYFGGVNATERRVIAQDIQLPKGSFPLRYLGVPMRPTKWRHEDWNRSKLHMASWHQVCLPKAYGGLGFRDGANWNRAILAKYIWAVSEKQDLLWVKWIKEIYLKGVNFWSYVLKPDSSWYWRKLCHLRRKFSKLEVLADGISGKFKPSKLYNSTLTQQLVGYKHAVWCKLTLPKHQFLHWQVVNTHLLTRDNLSRINFQLNSLLCPVCEEHNESHTHLFFECCLSKMTLTLIFAWIGFNAWLSNFNGWVVWLSRGRIGITDSILNLVLAVVIYSIWRNKNRCVFYGYSLTASSIAKEVINIVKYRLYTVNNRKISIQHQLFIRKLQCN
ncbi:uncharacterized protein LOC133818316 [Humulus lupulus]|uniref:uncharacterized protein LOC133818316 n=1 Tax=Humulus lupulus TaxID=3486 RepID=UPI002B402353|nr:uncharacterized protein LOC133818316 [Humulus lupulus]